MPIRDVEAMNRSLDNDYGTTAGPNAAASHYLALYDGNPMIPALDGGGVELASTGGYARVQIMPADWLPAADGIKRLVAPMELPAVTAEWPEGAEYWGLLDGADTSLMWDCGPLTEPFEITGPGPGPRVDVAVYYDDAVTEPEE